MSAVLMARKSTEVWTIPNSSPSSAMSRPDSAASATPVLRQVDVGPPGESILEVPGRFTVSEEHQFHGSAP